MEPNMFLVWMSFYIITGLPDNHFTLVVVLKADHIVYPYYTVHLMTLPINLQFLSYMSPQINTKGS